MEQGQHLMQWKVIVPSVRKKLIIIRQIVLATVAVVTAQRKDNNMHGKGYNLQRAGIPGCSRSMIGKRGHCALCECILTQKTSRIYYCEDCHAVYVMQENGLLDYIGRRET